MWPWHVEMPTQHLLRLLLLLMLMLRNVLTIAWCRFGSRSFVIRSNLCPDFEHTGWSRFWSLSLVEMLIFGWGFEVVASSRFWRWNLIKICVRTCDMTQPSGPLYLWQCLIMQVGPGDAYTLSVSGFNKAKSTLGDSMISDNGGWILNGMKFTTMYGSFFIPSVCISSIHHSTTK